MRFPLKSTPKWLLLPPAVAVLLILGPLSMQGGGANDPATPPATAAQPAPERAGRSVPTAPRTPDLWQMSSALVGVLLLGAAGLFALKRLRGGSGAGGGAALVTVRQTIRLSGRQALHAIEFDDRILLVGEHDRGVVLLDRGRLPDIAADEAAIVTRHAPAADDDGAVPKDLVIPRPPAPRPNPGPAAAPAGGAARLGDFRSLLQKAGR